MSSVSLFVLSTIRAATYTILYLIGLILLLSLSAVLASMFYVFLYCTSHMRSHSKCASLLWFYSTLNWNWKPVHLRHVWNRAAVFDSRFSTGCACLDAGELESSPFATSLWPHPLLSRSPALSSQCLWLLSCSLAFDRLFFLLVSYVLFSSHILLYYPLFRLIRSVMLSMSRSCLLWLLFLYLYCHRLFSPLFSRQCVSRQAHPRCCRLCTHAMLVKSPPRVLASLSALRRRHCMRTERTPRFHPRFGTLCNASPHPLSRFLPPANSFLLSTRIHASSLRHLVSFILLLIFGSTSASRGSCHLALRSLSGVLSCPLLSSHRYSRSGFHSVSYAKPVL